MSPPPSNLPLLIVDDEAIVLQTLKETLEREGFPVVTSQRARKAIEIMAGREFSVIISDQRMPEMSGLEFLVECKKLQPHASRILITAVLSLPTIIDSINKGEIFRFLTKPWLREELIATVKNAVNRYELIQHNAVLQRETQRLNTELTAANQALAVQVRDLELQRQALDHANRELALRYDRSLDLCCRILTMFDPLLGGQTKAMVEIAGKMAQTEYFQEEERQVLRIAAWLCDLGLIGVPRDLLRTFRTNPGGLGDYERTLIRNHPVYSQTLASYVDARALVGETIRAHHERFDGSGYPDSLAGYAIPWTARCLAVAVVFVESGLPKEQAAELVLGESGRALDPEAVRLFLKVTQLVELPRQVREVMLEELQPGMVLAGGIYSPHGLLLISEGMMLTPGTIAKIRSHNLVAPINQRLLVLS
ncbi:MAG: response regulator [Opitutaceae bacterium]|nr:response regulator [Opitutaceae bacterium]